MTVVLALAAALLFALGNVLQQRVAMRFPDRLAHSTLFLVRLAREPVWLAGTAVILLGFVFHAGALASGQIVVVQPILALTWSSLCRWEGVFPRSGSSAATPSPR